MSTRDDDLKQAIWTIRSIIANDAYAATHQTLGQYRTALLKGIANVMGEILLGDPTQHPALLALQRERDELRAQVDALTARCTVTHRKVADAAAPQPPVEVAGPVQDHISEAQAAVARNLEAYHRVADRRRAATTHPDDAAIDCFASEALKPKMAEGRAKGRSGWETCPPEVLSRMLREHVEKGDPRDVALFCMMLWSMGARIAAAPQPEVQAEVPRAIRLRFFRDLIDAERIKVFKVFGVLPDGAESQAETHAVQGMLLKHLWRSMSAPQPEAAQPAPCPGCLPGRFCKKPTCGRLLAAPQGGSK